MKNITVKKLGSNETGEAIVLILPLVLLMLVFTVIPTLSNFYYSLTKWNGISKPQFIGFDNYIRMIEDPRFINTLKNLLILIAYIPLGVLVPLVVAAVLQRGIEGWGVFRAIFYLPNVLGPVLLGIIYAIMFSQVGPITEIMKIIGVPNAEQIYLFGKSASAINTMAILFVIWIRFGFGVIYFLSAMSTIDNSLYESADLDGAGTFKKFIHVTVPSIIFSIQFFTVLTFIEVFARMYGLIFTLTRGGPGYATYTLEYAIYNISFFSLQKGYASAWAVVLFFLCSIIAFVQIRLIKKGGII